MQPWTYVKGRNLFAITRGEVDLSDRWMAYASIGVADSAFTSKLGNPVSSIRLPMRTVILPGLGRLQRVNFQNVAWQGGLRGEFETGPVNHQLNFNFTGSNNLAKTASVNRSGLFLQYIQSRQQLQTKA